MWRVSYIEHYLTVCYSFHRNNFCQPSIELIVRNSVNVTAFILCHWLRGYFCKETRFGLLSFSFNCQKIVDSSDSRWFRCNPRIQISIDNIWQGVARSEKLRTTDVGLYCILTQYLEQTLSVGFDAFRYLMSVYHGVRVIAEIVLIKIIFCW